MSSRLTGRPGSVPECILFAMIRKPARRWEARERFRCLLVSVKSLATGDAHTPLISFAAAGCRRHGRGAVAEYQGASPERRCSSRTFRYGYLVTT